MITVKLKKRFFELVIVAVLLFIMFKMPQAVSGGVKNGLEICVYTIIPSLFPFLILSTYTVRSETFSPLYRFFSPVGHALFRQPECAVPVILMSFIGGFPIGAKMTSSLLENKKITKNQAQRLLLFCFNGGPAFTITAVGINMLGNIKAGVIIYASLCLSSLILGFISAAFDDKKKLEKTSFKESQMKSLALSASVTDSVNTVLSMCAWIVLFSALTECINLLDLSHSANLFINSVTEVTKGCTLACKELSLPIITAIIGFGGFCIHCQIYPFISQSGLKYTRFLVVRIISSALSAVICFILLLKFPITVSSFNRTDGTVIIPFSVSPLAFFSLLIMCIILIFDIDTKRKV